MNPLYLDSVRTITRAGRWMARLPLPVRFARMLLFANQQDLMPYAIVLVAALSVPDFFLPDLTPPPSEAAESAANSPGKKRKREQKSETERLMQARTNFLRQFVKTVSTRPYFPCGIMTGGKR